MYRIGLDIGSDHDFSALFAALIIRDMPKDLDLLLFGEENFINEFLETQSLWIESLGHKETPFGIIHCPNNSSISKGLEMLGKGELDGFASAGNTKSVLLGAFKHVGFKEGISRPALISLIPKQSGFGVLLDVGANIDCKPEHLLGFAKIGSKYAKENLGIENPKVGLLNIGEEEEKGNDLTKKSFVLLKNSSEFNFIGNIEGNDILGDKADVYVCDGFIGNLLLKFCESLLPAFDFEKYGGMPILGLNKTVMVGHGRSTTEAFKNLILETYKKVKNEEILHTRNRR